MKVLVTGGAGYIGSHTAVRLLERGHQVVIVDNFANSSPQALGRIRHLSERDFDIHEVDVTDLQALLPVVEAARPDAVIHFAALKAVGESVADPARYYRTNIEALLNVTEAMSAVGSRRLVFSSSATVYGAAPPVPTPETAPVSATNPYGWTKVFGERILSDVAADPRWRIALLRYFNPVGAHPSGLIGEDPRGTPSNLLPYIAQVAVGRLERLRIFGDDYETPDGTGIRDFVHVDDLAEGHIAALDHLDLMDSSVGAWNLGTGAGTSVLELVRAFERASGRHVPYEVVPRRPGDVAVSYAAVAKARRELGWSATRSLDTMCADAWRWQHNNPEGYGS